ncbi:MAG: hypothetical protein AMXMBFR64_36970 [Myxococcales bacterium]
MNLKRSLILCAALALAGSSASAAEQRTLCVFDPSGANGDAFNFSKDYQSAAVAWGVELQLKPYTDEKTAVEDFKAGKCDGALLTGLRSRAFSPFAGTIEAMGAVQSYGQLKRVIDGLANPKSAKMVTRGEYEVAGIFPAGTVFLFVRDKALDAVSKLAGKRVATIDFDPAAKVLVDKVGASMVAADVGTFSGMFNNGSVDACYAPATAYQPLELGKGLGAKGGIVKFPLGQLTLQVLIRTARFPAEFGVNSRKYASKAFGASLKVVEKAEKAVPAKYWMDVTAEQRQSFDDLLREVRIRLRDKEKVYDKAMLGLLRRVRCKDDGNRAECAEQKE